MALVMAIVNAGQVVPTLTALSIPISIFLGEQ